MAVAPILASVGASGQRDCAPWAHRIVVAALDNQATAAVHLVDQAVLLGDPAGPGSGAFVLERLGFADTLMWIAQTSLRDRGFALQLDQVLWPSAAAATCWGGAPLGPQAADTRSNDDE